MTIVLTHCFHFSRESGPTWPEKGTLNRPNPLVSVWDERRFTVAILKAELAVKVFVEDLGRLKLKLSVILEVNPPGSGIHVSCCGTAAEERNSWRWEALVCICAGYRWGEWGQWGQDFGGRDLCPKVGASWAGTDGQKGQQGLVLVYLAESKASLPI